MGRRGAAWTIAGAVVTVVVSACAVPHAKHATPAAASSTLTRSYAPYAATGTITVPVAANHSSGACWTGSIAIPKTGVYRCLVGNSIADPCFAVSATARQVVCAADPWTPATIVDLTKALPTPPRSRVAAHPWALELANGAHCVAVTGTVAEVQGVSLTYSCGSGHAAGALDSTRALTTAQYGPPDGPLASTAVAVLWNG